MSYSNVLSFISQKTVVVELSNQSGNRVAVCPQWSGRVVTSCCDGFDSPSFGFINVPEIEKTGYGDKLCNFGGEDVWTISPVFCEYDIENDTHDEVVLKKKVNVPDANGEPVRVQLQRTISLLDNEDVSTLFGASLAQTLKKTGVLSVGFASSNVISSYEAAVFSSRMRGTYLATEHTTVLAPMMPDYEESEQFLYRIDFLGMSPHQRIRHLPAMLLFKADGDGRCQLSIRRNKMSPILGAIEFRDGNLTLWTFEVPEPQKEFPDPFYAVTGSSIIEPGKRGRMNTDNFIRIYNHGDTPRDRSGLKYYEVNSFSAPQDLYPDEKLTYCQYTLHINAENEILNALIQDLFGVSYGTVLERISL